MNVRGHRRACRRFVWRFDEKITLNPVSVFLSQDKN